MTHKKPKKAKARKKKHPKMVPAWQAWALIVELYIAFALCFYNLYLYELKPHPKYNITDLSPKESECFNHRDAIYCCAPPWLNWTRVTDSEFGWRSVSRCIKEVKTPPK